MILVPVRGDKIHVKDDSNGSIRVEHVSDAAALAKFKLDIFPATYVRAYGRGASTVEFKHIVKINDVDVEFDSDTNMFTSQHPIKRRFNLPQIGEKYQSYKFSGEKVISAVKLMNENSKFNEIMVSFEDSEDDAASEDDIQKSDTAPDTHDEVKWYSLNDIVIRNMAQFQRYYFDYIHRG